jgi:hypothetical protein
MKKRIISIQPSAGTLINKDGGEDNFHFIVFWTTDDNPDAIGMSHIFSQNIGEGFKDLDESVDGVIGLKMNGGQDKWA